MASIKLRPNGSTGTNWSNMTNAHDGNESTCASVSVSRFNYSSRYMSLNFDTSVIPSGATINRATLTLRSKAGKTTITAHVDINGVEGSRVINQKQSTTITNYTADITSYMSDLSLIVVTPYNSNWSGNTFELYELWIDVDYTEPTAPVNTLNIKLGSATINNIYLGNTKITKVYIGDILVFEN